MTTLTPELIETERELVDLRRIGPNPYQTRLTEDQAHIAALAEDILANGLLQVPLARPQAILNETYELAFGHTRLAAFKLLVEQGHAQFAQMPLDVRPLTDRQMSDLAASENARRKNLTAIETATALQTRIQAFKLSQAEAGQPFGLSQSAVANLLRLLSLPQTLQDMVHTGELPERHARQLATMAKAAPKEVERIAKTVAKAKPADRDEALGNEIGEFVQDQGRDLRTAPFETDWPLIPIVVNAPTGDQPATLQACLGCQHLYRHDWGEYCCLPACYDLKAAAVLEEQLAAAVKKTGVRAAGEDEKTFSTLNKNREWDRYEKLPELIKAGKSNAALGLVLVIGDEASHYMDKATGSCMIHLHTTAPSMVNNWFAAKDSKASGNGTGKAVVVPPPPADPSKETAAQKAKREAAELAAKEAEKEAERQAQEERRRERAAALKSEADVVWLIKNYVEIVAPQLTISGNILMYAVHQWINRGMGLGRAAEFAGLRDWYDELESAAEEAGQGKEGDALRRKQIVAYEALDNALGHFGDKYTFGEVVDQLVDLSTDYFSSKTADEAGLGAKLPAGWNKPPIHKTAYNCWHCGTFASNRGKLTQGEIAAGWSAEYKGEKVLDVRCPDCQGKPAPKAMAIKPAAKKGGKK